MRVSQIFANSIGLAFPSAVDEPQSLTFFDRVTDLFETCIADCMIDPVLSLDPASADITNGAAHRKSVDRGNVTTLSGFDRNLDQSLFQQ